VVGLTSTARLELEDDLVGPHEAEVVARDALDGAAVVAEAGHAAAQRLDLAPDLGVLLVDVGELLLQTAQAGETLRGEDQHGGAHHRHHEDGHREHPLDELRVTTHGVGRATRAAARSSFPRVPGWEPALRR